MEKVRVRSLLLGSTWSFLPISVLVGIVYLALLHFLLDFIGVPRATEFVVVVVPASIALTRYGAGLVPNWAVVFPFALYAYTKPPCAGPADCRIPPPPTPGPIEVLPQAAVMAVIAGTAGYGFTTVVARKREAPSVWALTAYYFATLLFAVLLVIYLDTLGLCLIVPC